MSAEAAARSPEDPTSASTWTSLRQSVFRNLWIASFASNVGTWMRAVGAQRLLIKRHSGPKLIALVQTASTLAVLLVTLARSVGRGCADQRP